ncbi:hypothetical protein [Natrinema pallidum]|uniref:Uncharacterized protein n=1 Tax=Natrinema pallidum DSM 3751 TaxID=1227495 RepID=L9Z7T0_9EURY|nr:hypothetical protein [Natrinema pallidum]ELY82414.1 hypothetical protein C487_01811 [Natrinema pallidum DSM 3751]
MTVPYRLRTLGTVSVYAICLLLAGFVFVAEPTDALIAIPIGSGSLLLVHAVTTNQLDELGSAIMGLYGVLLLTSVSLGLGQVFVIGRGDAPIDPVGTTGTVAMTTVLVGGYLLATR